VRRREALAGIGSVGVLAGSGYLLRRELSPPASRPADGGSGSGDGTAGSDDEDSPSDSDEGTAGSGDEASGPPFTVETIDAPGSTAGTVDVPESGTVYLLEFFLTTCATCRASMPELAAANAELEDVTLLSVLDPSYGAGPSAEELREWWIEYGGEWAVGFDGDGSLHDHYDVFGRPKTVVIDGEGESYWRNHGRKSVDELLAAVEGVEP